MQVGDLVRHKDYPQSLAIIVETFGKPTGNRIHPPTIQVVWCVAPSDSLEEVQKAQWTDTFGSVWLEVVK